MCRLSPARHGDGQQPPLLHVCGGPPCTSPRAAPLRVTSLQVMSPSSFELICDFVLIWFEFFELIQTLGGETVVQDISDPIDHETAANNMENDVAL
jgi:hypothetical protein